MIYVGGITPMKLDAVLDTPLALTNRDVLDASVATVILLDRYLHLRTGTALWPEPLA